MAVVNIAHYQKTRWIFQDELNAIAGAWAEGCDAADLMRSLSERFAAGAEIERGPLSVEFETTENGGRVLALIDVSNPDNTTEAAS